MTGGRIKRLKSFIGNEPFLLTYGDGVADINLDDLVNFHKSHGRMVTMTAVRPAARFGDLDFDGERVASFQEKSQLREGWINGGFFVCEPSVFDFIDNDAQMFEREPLERILNAGELMAYKHKGFWHCMDTKRDRDLLESMWSQGAPWVV
jgi:glucose-1-phosphate cytidylyltransferase